MRVIGASASSCKQCGVGALRRHFIWSRECGCVLRVVDDSRMMLDLTSRVCRVRGARWIAAHICRTRGEWQHVGIWMAADLFARVRFGVTSEKQPADERL